MQVYCAIEYASVLEYTYTGHPMSLDMANEYTSLRVSKERKMLLERAAIDISYKTGTSIKWTDVANYMFDHTLNDVVKDLKSSTDIKNALKK